MPAHADFKSAIESYIALDGTKLLHDVEDAVKHNNNDGLLHFLDAMRSDRDMSDFNVSTLRFGPTTLEKILKHSEWVQLKKLLMIATKNSSLDDEYYLHVRSQFKYDFCLDYLNENISNSSNFKLAIQNNKSLTYPECANAWREIKKQFTLSGSQDAQRDSDSLFLRAKAGHPESQLVLALEHFEQKAVRDCKDLQYQTNCALSAKEEGFYWLNLAVQSYDLDPRSDMDFLAYNVCELLRSQHNHNHEILKQAYLWALVGIEYRKPNKSRACLMAMHRAGELKLVNPKLDKSWLKNKVFARALYANEPLPNLLKRARSLTIKEGVPVFTFFGLKHNLGVYRSGKVFDLDDRTILAEVKPEVVEKFLSELEAIGFYDWNFSDLAPDSCHDNFNIGCKENGLASIKAVSRDRGKVKQLQLQTIYFDSKQILYQRMSKLYSLVTQFFPYQKYCALAQSEHLKQKCSASPLYIQK